MRKDASHHTAPVRRGSSGDAGATVPDPSAPAERVLREMLLELLDRIELRAEGLQSGSDPEDLRVLRTSTRKTRVLLGQLRGVFPKRERSYFREEFRQVSIETGACRDLDTLSGILPARRGLAPLASLLHREQATAHGQLARYVTSPRFRVLTVDWRVFLEDPVSWGKTAPDAATPIRESVRRAALRAFRLLSRSSMALGAAPSLDALHAVRIDGKKLRYLLGQFRALLPDDARAPILASMQTLHDALGRVQDHRLHLHVVRRLSEHLHRAGPLTLRTVETLQAELRTKRETFRAEVPAVLAAFRQQVTSAGIEALFVPSLPATVPRVGAARCRTRPHASR